MDKTTPWNSLKNVVLGLAVLGGALAGFAARYYRDAPHTAQWRRERYAVQSEQTSSNDTIGANRTAVQ